MVRGIDLSNNNPTADFAAIKAAGYTFCIHKASEGIDFVDRYLVPRWYQMGPHGLVRGAYHYARPSANTARDEAEFFLVQVQPLLDTGDSVWLDMEDDRFPVGGNVSPWTLEWCDRVAQALGFAPGIYTYPSYVPERHLTDPRLGQYPLWWASYQQPMRPVPAPWTTAAVWQTTSDGSVPGTTGRIDLNELPGNDLSLLVGLGMPASVVAADSTGPHATADAAFDAWCVWWDDVVVVAGQMINRGHWYGRDPQEVARTEGRRLLAYDGAYAQDATGYVIDDWEVLVGDQLTLWGTDG